MDRKEMMAALKAKGIKFSNAAKDEKLKGLLGLEGDPQLGETPVEQPVAPSATPEESNSQLMEILLSITASVKKLENDWQDFQKAYPRNTEVFAIGGDGGASIGSPIVVKQENGSTFLTQVPVDLLKAAKDILGEKFSFECDALKDRPAFMFTVIVPKEYSNSDVEDKRSRVIDNALGANGVREWCSLIKANVIKTLGIKISV